MELTPAGRRLRSALGFLRLPPTELALLHRWLESWAGLGLIALGLERQGLRRVIDVRLPHARAEIVQNHDPDGPAQSAKCLLVQLGPASRARREGQQANALAAVAEREHEQSRAAVLSRDRMPHHRPGPVIDLAFFADRRDDHRVRRGGPLAAERDDEAANARVLGGKAVIVDEVAPDRHGIAPAGEGRVDQFAIGCARAGGRRAPRRRGRAQQRGDPRRKSARVGRHLTGRIWTGQPSMPRIADGDPGGLEVGAGGLAPHPRRLFDASERPAQLPKGQDLLLFVVTQDVGHPARGTQPFPPRQRLGARYLTGRFSGVDDWRVLGVDRGAVVEMKPDRLINLAYGIGPARETHTRSCASTSWGCLGGVKRVVYASSLAVSGQQSHFGERLVHEDDPTYGTSQYAVHKIFNEFQARQYIRNYGMSITGVRPANVTGPDKVRGSTDHVQLITGAARGEAVDLPRKGLMRLLIHVEDIAEVFARVLLADAPRYDLYNSGGVAVSLGELADIVREFLPDAKITFAQEGGREESGNYLVDNSRLCKEFGIEYPPLRTRVLDIINDARRQEGLPQIIP